MPATQISPFFMFPNPVILNKATPLAMPAPMIAAAVSSATLGMTAPFFFSADASVPARS